MADFYLDNDVSFELAPFLQSAGHQITTTRDLGLFRAADEAQLLTAARNGWVLVTSNRGDFTMLHDAWLMLPAAFDLALPPHPGILALDQAPPPAQFSAIQALLDTNLPAPWANELFWWRSNRGWQRRIVGTGWERYS